MKGKKTYFASRNVVQLPHYLPSNKQLFIRPSLTPKQIAANTQAYRFPHAEASHYPFCITSPFPSSRLPPQTSLTSTKNSKGKTRANTLQRMQRKGWKRPNVCSGGNSCRPPNVMRVCICSKNVDRTWWNTSCLLPGNKLQYMAAYSTTINKVYIYIYFYYRLRWSRVACWPLVPKFAGSNPAEAVRFLGRKNPQHAFLRRGSKICGM